MTELESLILETCNMADVIKALNMLDERLQLEGDTTLSDIKVLLNVNTGLDLDGTVHEIRTLLIEQEYIRIEGNAQDENSLVESVNVEEFRQDMNFRKRYDPHTYYDRDVKDRYNFRPKKLADELIEENIFLKIKGRPEFYVFQKGYWQDIAEDFVKTEVDKRLQNESSQAKRNNVLEMIQADERIQLDERDFEHTSYKIPFNNGAYNLKTGELEDHNPENYFTYKYSVNFNPSAQDDRIYGFIDEIVDTEAKKKKLKQIPGLVLQPDIPIEKGVLLIGKGSNGKNLYIDILAELVGIENTIEMSPSKIQDDTHARADLIDKQLVYDDEFSDITNSDFFKKLTGSDHLAARPLYQSRIMFRNTAFPIYAANELPRTNDQSDGFFRRWEMIEFPYQFTNDENDGHKDKLSKEKLKNELFSQEALEYFAYQAVKELEEVRAEGQLHKQMKPEDARLMWNDYASPVYSFLDKFVKPGKLPDPDKNYRADAIAKETLTTLIGNYAEERSHPRPRKDQITKALEAHSDLNVRTDYRKIKDGGREVMAYGGIKFDFSGSDDLEALSVKNRSEILTRGLKERFMLKYIEIVEHDFIAKALYFLEHTKEKNTDLVELIKALDLSKNEIKNLRSSKYISFDQDMDAGDIIPLVNVNSEIVQDAIEQADLRFDSNSGQHYRPLDWVKSEMESWSRDTQILIDDLVEKAENEEGFQEESIENAVQKLQNEGEVFEPKPGKIQVME